MTIQLATKNANMYRNVCGSCESVLAVISYCVLFAPLALHCQVFGHCG